MLEADCIVVGAGVIGLAVARAIAINGRQVFVLEQEPLIGSHTSSRNSEVIHAGIYYARDSLKAIHCVRGKRLLYDYCQNKDIPVNRIGKLIVASHLDQNGKLLQLEQKARQNGVDDLVFLAKDDLRSMEPDLNAICALYSPSTGIIDSHSLMLNLQSDIEANGGCVLTRHTVVGGKLDDRSGIKVLSVETGDEIDDIAARSVINCGGLYSAAWLQYVSGFDRAYIPPMYFAKGNYFSLNQKHPFSHLIYPLPEEAGLGIHLTIDIAGNAKFGPDVEWLPAGISPGQDNGPGFKAAAFDYRVDDRRKDEFYQSIRKYFPGLDRDALVPGYSGIRPKLVPEGSTAADFVIQGSRIHGVNGWINLFGFESPGLTASLSLAIEVADRIERELN